MRKRTLLGGVTIAVCALVAAGGLFAANMAFKLNYRLLTTTPGVSANGKNTLSLPYFRHAGLDDAQDLMDDIGFASVASCSRYNELTDGFAVYTGRMGTPFAAFPLAAGEGYFISMNASRDYIVVGAHDPSLSMSLETATPLVSKSGKNFVAPPYNITATNALQVMQDIGGGSILPVASISRYRRESDSFAVYTGRMGSPTPSPFVLVTGEALFVSMNATTPWLPSHY